MSATDKTISPPLSFGVAVRAYYRLTKPGIIRGNAFAATAGFFLASQGSVDLPVFLCMLTGLSLVIASGCVSNNYMDRFIDTKMARTSGRALATGLIDTRIALVFAAVLGTFGTGLLLAYTTPLAAGLAVFGWIAYVYIYGAAKRASVHGTLVGSISGAVPPLVGYTAITGRIDLAAILLFIILVAWQMPHFYAIALYRLDDYVAAGIPVLPARAGRQATKRQIVLYIIAFTVAASLLTFTGYASTGYLVVALLLGIGWFIAGIRGFSVQDTLQDNRWARRMFGFSLLALTGICIMLTADSFM